MTITVQCPCCQLASIAVDLYEDEVGVEVDDFDAPCSCADWVQRGDDSGDRYAAYEEALLDAAVAKR